MAIPRRHTFKLLFKKDAPVFERRLRYWNAEHYVTTKPTRQNVADS